MTTEIQPSAPTESDRRMVCAQIQGGNGAVHCPVQLPGVKCVLYSQPSDGGSGGDVYFMSLCGSGLLSRFCVADVVGHGEAVASVSREMHDALGRLMNWTDHRRVLRRLNRLLHRKGLSSMTTMAVATYYPPSGKLSYSYAGHLPGWYFTAQTNQWQRLTLPDDRNVSATHVDGALAVEPDAAFTRAARRARTGDRLVLVTDGVLETFDAQRRNQFGTQRLERALDAQRDAPLEQLVDHVLDSLRSFSADDSLGHDDVTMLAMEFTEAPSAPALWHVLRNRVLRPLGLAHDIAEHTA
jgi:sigma-B regulation protein RsbU (phosphoserine phosphatase)